MIIKSVNLETVCGITSKLPENLFPEIAFAGKSNVGKSSLINGLMNRKSLARTSSQPGKTQTINFYNINENLYFVDLPGYGYAIVSRGEKRRWADLMDAYFSTNRNIALVVQLVDMRHKPSQLDLEMIDYLEQMGYEFVIALTKSDKLNKTQTKERLDSLKHELSFLEKEPTMIPVSSLKGDGIDELKNYISLKVEV